MFGLVSGSNYSILLYYRRVEYFSDYGSDILLMPNMCGFGVCHGDVDVCLYQF